MASAPFADFAPLTPLREAIAALTRVPEPVCVPPLVAAATVPPDMGQAIAGTARSLVEQLRAAHRPGGVQALVQEFALSSPEGVALMCLAEALLRIPDDATRDALIRDKIADGDWLAHAGGGKPVFVNAAAWGLALTGRLTGMADEAGLGATLARLVGRVGEPVIRAALDRAMRMMGEQFVTGQTIAEALQVARRREARGYQFSFDMLGEAAATAADAARYYGDYERAIRAIGAASAGRGPYGGPGISIKLSALHPRYARAKAARVMAELLPRVRALAALARAHDIGFNIDAEEADRLELSLDLLEALALDPALAGWNGLGFVVQAYQKRCPAVIDWIVDLARRSGRRIMVRLVKGAYWDAEIKRAQVDGLAGFPVYTRKVHTDVAYLACARRLLDARDAVFPQFATHNAQTVASVLHMAGPAFAPGDWEFQCLHGMGEGLYDAVVGPQGLDRPCRVYAPVGTHETLLAYLVRRLLENGANSSFVHRIADPAVPVAELIADPAAQVAAMPVAGAPHERIALPAELLPGRTNSAGIDLADERALAALGAAMAESAGMTWTAGGEGPGQPVRNPADHRDVVGMVCPADPDAVAGAVAVARGAGAAWGRVPVAARAAMLERAANLMQERMPLLIGLIVREAGKTAANAVGEVREAIDFLRFYAAQGRDTLSVSRPLGPVACISPWNFPLAIFTGQIAAALVAGNPVLAKPAPETPLIAAEAVRLLHAAGVPQEVLQLLPGDGPVGAALVAHPAVMGVLFTGSTATARAIRRAIGPRLTGEGTPVPFIAETGGQNAMIVDSSALTEQVVADVVASAFDSAGQRCSALRVLCLQEDVADRTLAMLKGAMAELAIGNPARLSTDLGPVISPRAREGIVAHIAAMRARGHAVFQAESDDGTAHGTFVPPTLIEIGAIAELEREVFGPVLHVVRFAAGELDRMIDAVNATGYGLTFGLHTRLDETIERVTGRIAAGNLYVNRNTIGAVVGVQPFGGRGLSGTGPKAGGPLSLVRLAHGARLALPAVGHGNGAMTAFSGWAREAGFAAVAAAAERFAAMPLTGLAIDLPGPVGESNRYSLHPRGVIAVLGPDAETLWAQVAAALATGNQVTIPAEAPVAALPPRFPPELAARIAFPGTPLAQCEGLAAVLAAPGSEALTSALATLAGRDGPLTPVFGADTTGAPLPLLVEETVVSINTTAAGGNASLMAMA